MVRMRWGVSVLCMAMLVACSGSGGTQNDGGSSTGGIGTGSGSTNGTGGTSGSTGASSGSSGSGAACPFPATDTFSFNGTSYSNAYSQAATQSCDPLVEAFVDSSGATEVIAYSGYRQSDSTWAQQVELAFTGSAPGSYPATGTFLTNHEAAQCPITGGTVTVTQHGGVGAQVVGSYQVTITDSHQTGDCPDAGSGTFAVTRAQ